MLNTCSRTRIGAPNVLRLEAAALRPANTITASRREVHNELLISYERVVSVRMGERLHSLRSVISNRPEEQKNRRHSEERNSTLVDFHRDSFRSSERRWMDIGPHTINISLLRSEETCGVTALQSASIVVNKLLIKYQRTVPIRMGEQLRRCGDGWLRRSRLFIDTKGYRKARAPEERNVVDDGSAQHYSAPPEL